MFIGAQVKPGGKLAPHGKLDGESRIISQMHSPLLLGRTTFQLLLPHLAAVVRDTYEIDGLHLHAVRHRADLVDVEKVESLRLNRLIILNQGDLRIVIENDAVVVLDGGEFLVGEFYIPIGKQIDRVFLQKVKEPIHCIIEKGSLDL